MLRRLFGQFPGFPGLPPEDRAAPEAVDAGLPLPVPVIFVRNPRARRYVLRLTRERVARVTIPRGGSEAFARRFLREQEPWLRRQLEKPPPPSSPPRPWGPGTEVWFRGRRVPIALTDGRVRLGDGDLGLPASRLAGRADWRAAVEAALRRQAARELPPLVLAAAARWGLSVDRVTVRDQRSRWGSCSRRRTISLNWRLVQTPEFVRDYIIAHELAHLREMNHSRRFWRVVGEFFPGWREAEAWLKAHGRELIGAR